jgi:hypothetical protein
MLVPQALQASSALLIYYCEKASDLTTSDPSPREVVVQLLTMKSSHIKIKMRETGTPRLSQRARRETPAHRDDKNQDARDGNAPLVAAREMKTPARRDDKRQDACNTPWVTTLLSMLVKA